MPVAFKREFDLGICWFCCWLFLLKSVFIFRCGKIRTGHRSATTMQQIPLLSFIVLHDLLSQVMHVPDCSITYVLDQNRSNFEKKIIIKKDAKVKLY